MTNEQGRVGVVTGGASGIGEGIVRRFVADGGRCVVADLQIDRAAALAAELGDVVIAERVDVTVDADVATTASHMAAKSRNGRAAFPADVAAVAVFLASEDAWYVNGACLVIDGAGEVLGEKVGRYSTSPASLVGPALRGSGPVSS